MSSLKFGTSGLRGLVTDLTDETCCAYAAAFIAHMRMSGQLGDGAQVLVGRDLRSSSPHIAEAVLGAIGAEGLVPIDCGELPTPALALEAMRRGAPAVMVTGSHIPDDRNGLKFYRADGEIDKQDEQGILAQMADTPQARERLKPAERPADAIDNYIARYASLGRDLLAGARIGVYQHSSVARDLITTILEALGAEVIPFGRADHFVPVDTEALRPEDVQLARSWIADHAVDAIVSTDGDADRPLIADENGAFIRGDIVGILTAQWLGADRVVTPVTSTSAVETSGLFESVTRTRVGSPFVIAGMAEGREGVVVGFEANGGVLLGTDAPKRKLSALPTRDAMLPIIAVAALALKKSLSVSALVATLPARFTASDRIKETPASLTGPFLERLAEPDFARRYTADVAPLESLDTTDGVRIALQGGNTLHYRASGNAPELRCYTEAGDTEAARTLLAAGLAKALVELQRH